MFEAYRAAQLLPDPGWPWYRSWPSAAPITPPEQAEDPHGGLGLDNFGVADDQHASPAPAVLGPKRVAWLADQARVRFHAAA